MISGITQKYAALREKAQAQLDATRADAYKQAPRLAAIEREMAAIGLSLARLALAGDENALAAARESSLALADERERILRKLGMPADALTALRYTCATCSDTGYANGAQCKCLQQHIIAKYYQMSNIAQILLEENFDMFDIRLFSQEMNSDEGLSPRKNMEHIHKRAMRFVGNFRTEFANLLFYGAPGLGKSFIGHCITKDILDGGHTVLYATAPRLCKAIEDARFAREKQPDEMLRLVDTVDLLVLDDLGAEISTIITDTALFDILNQRLLTKKHTIISTNKSPAELRDMYSERTTSRFFGSYELVKFFGEDIRIKKKYG
jgi:DNA replication protein DnaC